MKNRSRLSLKAWGCKKVMYQSGFTLIEVLVVVAIIAIMAAILLPSLKRAREQATGAACKSNMKQLATGMLMYVTAHQRLPGNFTVLNKLPYNVCSGDLLTCQGNRQSWLGLHNTWPTQYGGHGNGPFSFYGYGPPHTTQDLWAFLEETKVPTQGSLFKYCKDNKVYLCPKDKRGIPQPADPMGGGGNGVFTYTMNYLLGWQSPEKVSSFRYVADFTRVPSGLSIKGDPVIPAGKKITWSQSGMILLLEEHPHNNTNQSYPLDNMERMSQPVFRHNPQSTSAQLNLAFLDGHAEAKRYPFRGDIPEDGGPWSSTSRGGRIYLIDILNDFMYPYEYHGDNGSTGDGGENEDAFVYDPT